MPNSKSDTVIPDHSLSGIAVEEGQTKTLITRAEFSALLMLFTKIKRLLPIDVMGVRLYVKLEQSLLDPNAGVFKMPKGKLSKAMTDSGWMATTDRVFRNSRGGRSNNDTTSALSVLVYSDSTGDDSNSMFRFFVNKSNGRYFVNANCAPTQVLNGRNDLPMQSSREPAEKAKFLVGMFVLPFTILGQLLDRYILKGCEKKTSDLTKSVLAGDISLQKIQLAAYTPEFPNKAARDIELAALYSTFREEKIRRNGKSASVASALDFVVDTSKTESMLDQETNKPIGITGFMLRMKYGGAASYSFGFYAKDEVQRRHQAADMGFATYGSRGTAQSQSFTERSIRLDLSIHTKGLNIIAKQMNAQYPEMQLPELPNMTTAKNVEAVFRTILQTDPTLGVIFKHVLEKHLCLGQLLAVTKKQWDAAFDILKEKGLTDLVEALRSRHTMHRSDSVEEPQSFKSLMTRFAPNVKSPTRLRDEIMKATMVVKKGIVLRPGVDLHFPFLVNQAARQAMVAMYEDPDAIDMLHETGRYPNDYDIREIVKDARRSTFNLYRALLNGNIRRIPTSGQVTL